MRRVRQRHFVPILMRKLRAGSGFSNQVSVATSYLRGATFAFDADGVTPLVMTLHTANAADTPLPDKIATVIFTERLVSAALTTLECFNPEIPDDGVTPANFLATIRNTAGNPVPGLPAAACVLVSDRGATDTIVALDAATDRFGRMRYTSTSETAGNPEFSLTVLDLAITETATTEVTSEGPPTPELVFEALFPTPGNTDFALTSDEAFDQSTCEGTRSLTGDVIDESPELNAYELTCLGPNHCCMVQKGDAVPASTSFYVRFLFENNEFGSKNDHAVAMRNIHGAEGVGPVLFGRDARFSDGFWRSTLVAGQKYESPVFANATEVRYEAHMEYLTATTFRIHPRYYDVATGVLLADESNFTRVDFPGTTLAAYYAGGGFGSLSDSGNGSMTPEQARDFGMGNEGPGSQPSTGGTYRFRKVGISLIDWIGA